MILLLSYDLRGNERPSAYDDVREMIEDHAVSWERPLFSQWLIETDESVQDWHDRMKDVTDTNDRWFIVAVTGPRQGWFDKSTWAWLNERV